MNELTKPSQVVTVGTGEAARHQLKAELALITSLDSKEVQTLAAVSKWVDSGAPLYRIQKPDVPKQHLIAYFLVVDKDYVLLVDHINAQLWLPTGGHVEINEHPRDTVRREVLEELGIEAEFLIDEPLFVTSTQTVGLTKGHTDVSIWYALKADRSEPLVFDESEFKQVKWFHLSEIPYDKSDPELERFVIKLAKQTGNPKGT